MKAVVANKLNEYAVVSVNLDPPKMGEVRIKMKATGVCHSDLSVVNGTIPSPFPVVLGHEGAGIIDEIGEGVTNVKVGDHVIVSFIPHCGHCFYCIHQEPFLCSGAKQDGNLFDGTTRVSKDGQRIFVMSFVGLMAEYAVVPAACVVALVDRLVHHAEIVGIKGQSYRQKEAQEQAKARAGKRKTTKATT